MSVAVYAWDLLEEVASIFITSSIVWSQVNNWKGTQLHPSRETGLKIYWVWPAPSEKRHSFSFSQSLSSESLHKPLFLLHQRVAAAAVAAAKSFQLCLTLCDPIDIDIDIDPIDSSPPGSTVPGILQARILKRVAISFSNTWKWKVKGKSLNHVRLFVTPWTAVNQAPPSMGLSRQEYWSGLPLPSPPSEGRQNEKQNHRKLTNLTTWTTALSNSMKLRVMLCRATQDGRVMVDSSKKM